MSGDQLKSEMIRSDSSETPRTRRAVLIAGAVAAASALALARPAPVSAAFRDGWHFCLKCRGLFFAGAPPKRAGVCPAGGKHNPQLTNYYLLPYDMPTEPDRFPGWYKCQKCRGLFYDREGNNVCPAGGDHKRVGDDYHLWAGQTQSGQDPAWGRCKRCGGMFNWAGGNDSRCPRGGGHALGEVYKLDQLT